MSLNPTLGLGIILSAVGSALFSMLLAFPLRRLALYLNILDQPDGALKDHTQPTAYLGGLAVLGSLGVTLISPITPPWAGLETYKGMFAGVVAIAILGLVDDIKPMAASFKLVLQSGLAASWVTTGLYLGAGTEQTLSLTNIAAIGASFIFILTLCNGINLIDVADGIACGITALAAIFLSMAAWIQIQNTQLSSDLWPMLIAISLAGASLGVLWHNWPKARMFLGDAGSLPMGLMLAGLTLKIASLFQGNESIWRILGLGIILSFPILEIVLLCTARIAKRQNPLHGSKDHIALRLKHAGMRPSWVCFAIYGYGLLAGISGLGISMLDAPNLAALCVGLWVLLQMILLWGILRYLPAQDAL